MGHQISRGGSECNDGTHSCEATGEVAGDTKFKGASLLLPPFFRQSTAPPPEGDIFLCRQNFFVAKPNFKLYSVAGQKERLLLALLALKWVIYQWVLTRDESEFD